MIHHQAGHQHPDQTIDDPAGTKAQDGYHQNRAIDQVVQHPDFFMQLFLTISYDDIGTTSRKALVKTQPNPDSQDCRTDNRIGQRVVYQGGRWNKL